MSRNIIGAITFLKDVAAGVTPAHPGFGLCYYLSGFGVRTGPYLWETWEHFSGDNQFPIPSPDGGHPGAWYMATPNLYVGEYGEKRRELAGHMARRMEEWRMSDG